jgi:hypothetical protein
MSFGLSLGRRLSARLRLPRGILAAFASRVIGMPGCSASASSKRMSLLTIAVLRSSTASSPIGDMIGIGTRSPSIVTTSGESNLSILKCNGSNGRPRILPSQGVKGALVSQNGEVAVNLVQRRTAAVGYQIIIAGLFNGMRGDHDNRRPSYRGERPEAPRESYGFGLDI